MKDERREPRMNVVSYLKISESGKERDLGRVSDISSDGIRLQASDPIETDTTYEFEMALPLRQGSNKYVTFHGEVVWCRKSPRSGFYDAGVQLVDVPQKTCKTIRQIIESTPFEQRRLSITRPRPMEY